MPDMRAFLLALEGKEWMLWLGVALTTAIKAVLWFTAAILALNQMPATHAIRWSCYALIANILPLLVFGALMTAMFFFAIIPFLLGMLVATPIYAIAHYVTYRDLFRAEPEA
jgi:uncharacterized membrane protein